MGGHSADGHRRAAVFVDFENVHIGLSNSSKDAGNRFATQPGRWIEWMEQTLGPFVVDAEEKPRKVLRRICYLDPAQSGRFRPYFTRAGFRVVDCPALTTRGKNSADIHMVLDILDTLAHPERYDEFIVLSVDADFTPVLLRLREHDRRTAMLVSGPAAAALQAACDFPIPDSLFFDEALGLDEDALAPPAPADNGLRERMAVVVRRLVAEADEPLTMARVAQEVRRQLGTRVDTTSWGGTGGFGKFAQSLVDDRLHIETSKSPGWLYDPTRHDAPVNGMPSTPVVPEVAERVHQVVGVPLLSSAAYSVLFEVLTTEARGAAAHGQAIAERAARDACTERGQPVARNAVHFVLLGYHYSGFDWTDIEAHAHQLATAFTDNVLKLASDAQMALTPDEQAQIRAWIEYRPCTETAHATPYLDSVVP
ncbi:NYN domain-containing protein [Actinokineospora enzanensis]|uniref:NYN domain-containing protein n=1 Tax=Actinokineospora enzanensis TaxID=155975 RepID=UPI00037F713F|nr:NYN domain-containing protein [Actinokineospora enzanensis]